MTPCSARRWPAPPARLGRAARQPAPGIAAAGRRPSRWIVCAGPRGSPHGDPSRAPALCPCAACRESGPGLGRRGNAPAVPHPSRAAVRRCESVPFPESSRPAAPPWSRRAPRFGALVREPELARRAAAGLLLQYLRKFAHRGPAAGPCSCPVPRSLPPTGLLAAEDGAAPRAGCRAVGRFAALPIPTRRAVRVTAVSTGTRPPAESSASRGQNQAYQPPSGTLSCAIFLDKARCVTRRETFTHPVTSSIRLKTWGCRPRAEEWGERASARPENPRSLPRPVSDQPHQVGGRRRQRPPAQGQD